MLKYDNDNTDIKKKLTTIIVSFAIILLVILIIINMGPINSFLFGLLEIVAPVIIGAAIAYFLNPILRFLEFVVFKGIKNKKAVRALSLVLTYVYAIALIVLLVSVIAPQLVESIFDIAQNYNSYLETAVDFVNNLFSKISTNFKTIDTENVKHYILDLFNESENIFQTIVEYIVTYGTYVVVAFKNILIGLFISIYILISKERLYAQATKGARAYLSNKFYNSCMRYLRITNATFGRFFIGKFFDAAIVFAITFVVLLIMKIKYAVLIAMIIGILNIIPFFGIIIGALISSLIVLFVAPDKLFIFLLIMLIIQQIDTNVIAPKILGQSAGISSLAVIIAVTIMGSYFGIVGMILGVPFFAVIISIVRKWLEKKLSAKNLPVATKEYYTDRSYSHENEEQKSITRMIFDPFLKRISQNVNKTISETTIHEDEDEEDEDSRKYPESEQIDSKKNTKQ